MVQALRLKILCGISARQSPRAPTSPNPEPMTSQQASQQLYSSILNGNRLALARLLTQIENNTPEGRRALSELFPYTGRAHLIGVTGAPGTGKSSLVNQLARYYRREMADGAPRKVAIVAVDPSSPFT